MDTALRLRLAALLLAASSAAGAGAFPAQGGYGFDALKPTTTTCHRIAPQQAASITRCEFSPAGYAFGLASQYHRCDALPRGEVFIYQSPEKCQAALETMQSNGP
ncbi:hypothetical protein KBY82_14795 [Cyanobium sp. AMD-g]|uniref:hypothetical protein n=1 Tax=Cyanobium sp. AMD-g TaxID=2823699 RepID=UPI0020CC0795|nr:hypothetical protein [Cyanobium sp. AMD-g]MCP9932047.1 hypothetical protein [Cyanobium sp. AMD-g]